MESRWYGPFTMFQVLPHGVLKLERDNKALLKVNGQRVKHYMGNPDEMKVYVDMDLSEV